MGKQTVTALGTLVALAVAFLGYEQTLGRLTDFEPIDVALLQPLEASGPKVDPPTRSEDEIAAERAFGPTVAANLARLKMYQVPKAVFSDAPPGRGLGLFIFFEDYKLREQDDPKLVSFTTVRMIYITGKPQSDGSQDDIYTLESDHALIRFDRDVEFGKANAQPLAGWVEGDVKLRSNQGTVGRDDDILVRTERLDYEKAKTLIWTEKPVEVTGGDGMDITGVGMEIELAPEKPKPPPGTVVAKKKSADVEKLRLLKDVHFHLMVEEDGHVLGGLNGASAAGTPSKATAPVAAAKPKGKAPLDVDARGPFNYDMKTLLGSFEKTVVVERKLPGPPATSDKLYCEKLLLQFAEKPEEKTPVSAAVKQTNGSLQSAQQKNSLSTVEAFGPADTVVVIAESQKLRATGDYLFHDAVKKQTTIRSEKRMVVLQDNTRIEGRSLLVSQTAATGPNEKSELREAVVDGPNGLLEVYDREAKGPSPPKELVVRFNKTLRVTPEKNAKSKMVDVDGGVELEVPKQPLLMTSEILHVRLEEVAVAGPPKQATPGVAANSKMEPTWLKAERSVTVSSPELDVAAGQSLTMHIMPNDGKLGVSQLIPNAAVEEAVKPVDVVALPEDDGKLHAGTTPVVPATTLALKPIEDDAPKAPPAMKRPEEALKLPDDALPKKVVATKSAASPAKKSSSFDLGLGNGKPRDPNKPPDKVDLRAETVEVYCVKVEGKTEARRAEAIGNVYIRRDAAQAPEDAVEIKGDRADFFRSVKGDRMIVYGGNEEGRHPAEIINKKFHLADCEHIDVNEVTNEMIVNGAGKLTLVGASLVNATDAPKNARSSDKPFIVVWSKKMTFDGLNAYFNGDVQSSQNSQRVEPIEEFVNQQINCREMTVYFKEKLSFHGAKSEAGKKMEVLKVVCDHDVVAMETIFHPAPGTAVSKANLFRYNGISAAWLIFDNVRRDVNAGGPKSRAVFIERNKETVAADGRTTPPVLPLTRTNATFGKMTYRQEEKVVDLFDSVKTIRSPVAKDTEVLNENKLRPEATCVDGDHIELQEHGDAEGRKQHDFKAIRNVHILTKDYEGFGDETTYDQTLDRFILKGDPAYLKKVAKAGVESAPSSGEQFEYFVKSGRVRVIGGMRAPNIDFGDGLKGKGKGAGVPVKGVKPKKE